MTETQGIDHLQHFSFECKIMRPTTRFDRLGSVGTIISRSPSEAQRVYVIGLGAKLLWTDQQPSECGDSGLHLWVHQKIQTTSVGVTTTCNIVILHHCTASFLHIWIICWITYCVGYFNICIGGAMPLAWYEQSVIAPLLPGPGWVAKHEVHLT